MNDNQYSRHTQNIRSCCNEQQLADLGLASQPESASKLSPKDYFGELLAILSIAGLAFWLIYGLGYLPPACRP